MQLPPLKPYNGFTLAELLICLAILGEIATFTIPKVITSQQNGQYNAVTKEAASMFAAAFQTYKLNGLLTSSTNAKDLTPYLNYSSYTTNLTLDNAYGYTTLDCATNGCVKLHSGAVIWFDGNGIGGTNTTTNALNFVVDPDGHVTDGTTNGPGKSVFFFIYPNGRLATVTTITSGTVNASGYWPGGPIAGADPPWFSW